MGNEAAAQAPCSWVHARASVILLFLSVETQKYTHVLCHFTLSFHLVLHVEVLQTVQLETVYIILHNSKQCFLLLIVNITNLEKSFNILERVG